ncbi:M13 family metallopeptidase [Neoasaia chiangmaiensis]|uniref:Peptidase M13 n=1 Tax=Neoasaia chiangmaiensis TaxID=320497 RepID=A0A1U9KMY9_9PROT|nr:M13 family metallopeptidase [Neoasaia chiangmaiensis]AQS87162.1 peptidase M13 [Neoasaia chiangmaiensis]
MSFHKRLLGAASALGLIGLASANAAPAPAASADAAKPYPAGWGFDAAGMDTKVKPGDDFFRYSNGTYVDNIVIPPDKSVFGPFSILADVARERVQGILREAGRNPVADPKTTEQKLGVYYATFLDEDAAEKRGVAPLQADLDAVKGVKDPISLAKLLGQAQGSFQFNPFGLGIDADPKDPTQNALMMDQGGLGLPDRDYYLKPDFAKKRAAYQAYIAKMLGMIGWPDATAQAAKIVALETDMSKVQWARADRRDPVKTYNAMRIADLAKSAPGVDWAVMFVNAGIPASNIGGRRLIVSEPSAITGMAKIIGATDYDTLRAWLAFHLADNAAPSLTKAFVQASFEFNDHELEGQPQLAERWKRAVGATSHAMGFAIGKIYVAKYFPPSAQARITELTHEVKAAFAERLKHVDWMAPKTREAALRKLNNFEILVGYPKKWRDYGSLVVKPGDLYGNAERAAAFRWQFELHHLDRKVDRDEWLMTPQTVNAYNNPTQVEVVFPAAILQPPFFDPTGDDAVNYGAIGGVIGHEMTHSFDDEGRQFDENGRLHQWWTKEDVSRFQALADRYGKQYDAFEVLPGVHLNGKLTMGENIADLGGLTLGLDAYHASLHGKPAPVVHGLTGDQRVFLGWSQDWREKVRDDAARNYAVVDPHSSPAARVNLPMHNIDAWYKAFDVQPGQKLYLSPEQRVKIW